MRYWFESTDEQLEIGAQIARWQKEGKISMIEKGDPYEQVKNNLIKIHDALKVLKEFGISKHVMKTYIYATSKVPKKSIDAVFAAQDEFFRLMGLK